MSSSTLNYPLLAIPAYYVFSLVPHAYAGGLLSTHGYKVNNANPKASMSPDSVKGKVPDIVFQKYQRAENAHSNSMEQMPLFATAVIASLIAERTTAVGFGKEVLSGDATGLTTFISAWFAIRAAYSVSYVQIADQSKSFIRSGIWAIGTGLAIYQIYKAAALLGYEAAKCDSDMRTLQQSNMRVSLQPSFSLNIVALVFPVKFAAAQSSTASFVYPNPGTSPASQLTINLFDFIHFEWTSNYEQAFLYIWYDDGKGDGIVDKSRCNCAISYIPGNNIGTRGPVFSMSPETGKAVTVFDKACTSTEGIPAITVPITSARQNTPNAKWMTNAASRSDGATNDDLSWGAMAGTAIGAVFGAAVVVALCLLLLRERRKIKSFETTISQLQAQEGGPLQGGLAGLSAEKHRRSQPIL
ncbi:hypothetical protein TW65_04939 [Stemphylium lycopersici]|nr:hypothetical protein TW65_04939 [Stemphylium lycopersici]